MARKWSAEVLGYMAAQILGAVIGAAVVLAIASGQADHTLAANGLRQNGYGAGYLGEYNLGSALLFEAVATFVFVTVILGATGPGAAPGLAGLAIGLILAGIHLVGINVTGVSVNPARSIWPAAFVGGKALADLWVFIVEPLAGGARAGVIHGPGLTRADG